MRIAIMQPYLYPYIGYFQLINAVDKFVMYDDVNFINRGYINRNSLLINGAAGTFTLPLDGASQNKKICEIHTLQDDKWNTKFLQQLKMCYSKAPFFKLVFELIAHAIESKASRIAEFNLLQLKAVCEYLNIKTELVTSSSIYKNDQLKGSERILDICVQEQADSYLNPPGGTGLYEESIFQERNIDLLFIKSNPITYPQYKNEFVPWLSIIDVMMFNSVETIKDLLSDYRLYSKEALNKSL